MRAIAGRLRGGLGLFFQRTTRTKVVLTVERSTPGTDARRATTLPPGGAGCGEGLLEINADHVSPLVAVTVWFLGPLAQSISGSRCGAFYLPQHLKLPQRRGQLRPHLLVPLGVDAAEALGL
jgi:hypothetical protein